MRFVDDTEGLEAIGGQINDTDGCQLLDNYYLKVIKRNCIRDLPETKELRIVGLQDFRLGPYSYRARDDRQGSARKPGPLPRPHCWQGKSTRESNLAMIAGNDCTCLAREVLLCVLHKVDVGVEDFVCLAQAVAGEATP